MIKKDHATAVQIVQDFTNAEHRALATWVFIRLFRADDPHFDEARFRTACQLSGAEDALKKMQGP